MTASANARRQRARKPSLPTPSTANDNSIPSPRVTPETEAQIGTRVMDLASRLAGGEPLARLLAERLEAAVGEAERERQVLDAMLPPVGVLSDATATQLLWNAQARHDALAEVGALTPAQLAEIRGVETDNPHSTVTKWAKAGRIFTIPSAQGRLIPAFQVDERGEPRPIVARVLAALQRQLRDWEVLLWFTDSSGYLDGARPLDLLSQDPERVIAAAAYQASLSED